MHKINSIITYYINMMQIQCQWLSLDSCFKIFVSEVLNITVEMHMFRTVNITNVKQAFNTFWNTLQNWFHFRDKLNNLGTKQVSTWSRAGLFTLKMLHNCSSPTGECFVFICCASGLPFSHCIPVNFQISLKLVLPKGIHRK